MFVRNIHIATESCSRVNSTLRLNFIFQFFFLAVNCFLKMFLNVLIGTLERKCSFRYFFNVRKIHIKGFEHVFINNQNKYALDNI